MLSEEAQILSHLHLNKITALYHFTYISNLKMIREEGGIYCKDELRSRGILNRVKPGGNDLSWSLDTFHGNWGTVSLYFTPYTPMSYLLKRKDPNLCFMFVDVKITTLPGVIFTDRNATATAHKRSSGIAGLKLVNFSAIHGLPRPRDIVGWKEPVQAEVLVPRHIPLSYIQKIVFVSEASRNYGEYVWDDASTSHLFDTDQTLFSDDRISSKPSFGYIDRISLTSDDINKTNAHLPRRHINTFSRKVVTKISAIANINSIEYTVIKAEWCDEHNTVISVSDATLETENKWLWWPSIDINLLKNGTYKVKLYIQGNLCCEIKFTVQS